MFGPRATSTRIRFVVSSTRVELICSFRTALMTVAASRKRFSTLSAAEYTSSDRISPLFRFSATSFSRGVGVSDEWIAGRGVRDWDDPARGAVVGVPGPRHRFYSPQRGQ